MNPKESRVTSRLPYVKGTLVFDATWSGTADQKAATLGFAALFWFIWLSLWLPLFTAVVWLVAPFYGTGQAMRNPYDSLQTLGLLLTAGLVLGAFLGLWGALQVVLNQQTARPTARPDASASTLASFHGVSVDELKGAWCSRRVVVHHNDEGGITALETSSTWTIATGPPVSPAASPIASVGNSPGVAPLSAEVVWKRFITKTGQLSVREPAPEVMLEVARRIAFLLPHVARTSRLTLPTGNPPKSSP